MLSTRTLVVSELAPLHRGLSMAFDAWAMAAQELKEQRIKVGGGAEVQADCMCVVV